MLLHPVALFTRALSLPLLLLACMRRRVVVVALSVGDGKAGGGAAPSGEGGTDAGGPAGDIAKPESAAEMATSVWPPPIALVNVSRYCCSLPLTSAARRAALAAS